MISTIYIGNTKRNFKTRYGKNISDIKIKKTH